MKGSKRIVKMRINGCKYFYLPCEDAHKIREVLDERTVSKPNEINKSLSWTISDLESREDDIR